MASLQTYKAIPKTTGEEWMSLAYVRMICAQVGLNIGRTEFDNGIDLIVGSSKPIGGKSISNLYVALQLKATINWTVRAGLIKYSLDAKNYVQLNASSVMDQYLVLCTLPHPRAHWLTNHPGDNNSPLCPAHEHAFSVFSNGVYYLSLANLPALGDNPKTGKPYKNKTVSIPISQRLTAISLYNLYKTALESIHA